MRTTFIALTLLLAGAAGGSRVAGVTQAPSDPPQTVEISAERFSFTPSEIKTTVGTTLKIRLRSDDTDHGFRIVGTGVDVAIPKRGRGTADVEFTPDQAGRYAFECSHICGAGHGFMRGVIIVRDRAE